MITKPDFNTINGGQYYSARQAAKYFGVHRCTLYSYVSHPERPLSFVKSKDNGRIFFLGKDLIDYKKAGLPKKGRRRMTS